MAKKIGVGQADAVILDMDGVIVDSEHQWKLVEGPFFRSLIPSWRDEDHHKIVGLGVIELHGWLVKEYGLTEPQDAFLAKCGDMGRNIYGKLVSLTEGIGDFLSDLKKRRTAVGLASSSPRAWIELVLERFDLEKEFAAVVSGDDVPGKTKPEPDAYLLAARRLGVEPGRCVAVEDSTLGVRAAKRAGLFCLGFRNGFNDEQDLSEADMEFRSFRRLDDVLTAILP